MYKIISSLNFEDNVTGSKVATGVATLLNTYSNLTKKHSKYTIQNNGILYLVHIYKNQVAGCTGLLKKSDTHTYNLHTCIAESHRHIGLGKFILYNAINLCETQNIYAQIRADNGNSLKLYNSLGFSVVGTHSNHRTALYTVGRQVK